MDFTLTIDSASSSTSGSPSETETLKEKKKEKTPLPKSEEEEEEYESAGPEELYEEETDFDSSFTPFALRWCYGRNIHIPFINLTSKNRKNIFYAAAHVGILYDYENKVIKFLQGHKNRITSISSDRRGKWIVTADAGEDSVIIVWNSENCTPTGTIFDPHEKYGSRLIGISPDATYLVSVSESKEQTIACWRWTRGEKKPAGQYVLESQYGKVNHIAFCQEKPQDFMMTSESCVLFGTWEKETLSVYVQERPKRFGKLCCSDYQYRSHYALTVTDNGYLLMWSDVPFSGVNNLQIKRSNNKTLLKTLSLDKEPIKVIKAHQDIIVTGNESGELRFYDKMLRILYWVQSFQLPPITAISFHLWYDSDSLKIRNDSCSISDRIDPFKPFYALERAFEIVLEKEKAKLEDLKSFLKVDRKADGGEEGELHDEALIADITQNVLRDVEQIEHEIDDKKELVQKIIKITVNKVEEKLSHAIAHTEELIENFVDAVFKEISAKKHTENSAKDVAHSIVVEIIQSLDEKTDDSKNEPIIRDILDEVVDAVDIAHDIMEDIATVKSETTGSLAEVVIERVFDKIEDKFTIDIHKVVESLVKNMVKDIEIIQESEKDEKTHEKLYCRLKSILERGAKEILRVPSDASLQRKPFIIGDFMIATIDGDIGLVNFMHNTYTMITEKCESPVTALDCNLEKQQFAVGNATGYIFLYNFLKSRTKILESRMVSEKVWGVTSLKFAPSGFYLACGLSNGSFHILDPSILTPLLKLNHMHVDAPITQIVISDDSFWIAHKDDGMRVCLYKCEDSSGTEIEFMGKQKSHFKPIRDLMFVRSHEDQLHLLSLGEDRMLVEYDLIHSETDDLRILLIERIEQSAIPYCMGVYPKFGAENFILVANNEYKFKIFNDDSRMCRKTALGPRFEKPVSKFIILPKLNENSPQYMIYACEKHIGIQMFPLDGNPYKSIGMVGHPLKITHMEVYPHSQILLTVGEDDHSIFMWTINARSVNIMAHIGGEGLKPYFCLIEGGENGWLYKEMQDFFYYAQILHEGENTTSERTVSHELPLCEVPDLMRAIGYFPSEHEIGIMLQEIQFWTYSDNGKPQKYISFEDFVKLYVNHQPAFGTPFSKLHDAVQTFADSDGPDGPVMLRETMTSMLQERAECLSQEQVVKYLQVLIPPKKDENSQSSSGSSSSSSSASDEAIWNFIPEEISYKLFMEEILGIQVPKKDPGSLEEVVKQELYKKIGLHEKEKEKEKEEAEEEMEEEEEEELPEEEEERTEEEVECVDDFD